MSLPMPLVEVLEDEDLRLTGEHPPSDRRWALQPWEIIDARVLARELAGYFGPDAPEKIRGWESASAYDPEYKNVVANEVNTILARLAHEQRWLFQLPGFAAARKAPYTDLGPARDKPIGMPFTTSIDNWSTIFFKDSVRPAADVRYGQLIDRFHSRAKIGKPRTALSISGGHPQRDVRPRGHSTARTSEDPRQIRLHLYRLRRRLHRKLALFMDAAGPVGNPRGLRAPFQRTGRTSQSRIRSCPTSARF